MTRLSLGFLCAVGLLLVVAPTLAHHLEVNQLALRPVKNGELRGRFLLAPRTFPVASTDASPAVAQELLLTELRARVRLEVAGAPCTTPFIPVEVWTEASPSPGHLVDIRCPAPIGQGPPSVTVFWRGPGELSVSYPRTETTEAVSLVLNPGGSGSVLATAVNGPAGAADASAVRPLSAGAAASEQRVSRAALTAGQLAFLLLSLAVFHRVLGARRGKATHHRAWLLRAGTLGIVALGAALLAARLLTG